MTTFSQLVDLITTEVRRPDMRSEICTYLNQTIREAHFEPDKGNSVFYLANLMQLQITATLDQGQGWDIPVPSAFQGMKAVRFDNVFNGIHPVWPPFMNPGRNLAGQRFYYYRAGGSYFFSGYGGINAKISLAYYEFPRRLKYYAAGARPAEYDEDAGWTYDPAFDTDDATRQAAREFVGNWMLDRWEDVIGEGLRAKVYKRTGDDSRARLCYSQYTTLRKGLYTSEVEPGGGG